MKAEISENGVITIIPENSTEAYAMKRWGSDAWVSMQDIIRGENGHWRGSMLMLLIKAKVEK